MVIDWWEVTQTVALVLGSILWYYLRTGGTVTVSLEFNRSQNGIVNYVIHNGGSAKIEDIRAACKTLGVARLGAQVLLVNIVLPGSRPRMPGREDRRRPKRRKSGSSRVFPPGVGDTGW